ncbi:MAG: hypothetical protein HYU36_02255 [Planctomycetes bacterium]|nr:hypothetical protein [Planctomycetota bacterium]
MRRAHVLVLTALLVYPAASSLAEEKKLVGPPHIDFPHEFIGDMVKAGEYLYAIESEALKQLYVLKFADTPKSRTVDVFRLETLEEAGKYNPEDISTRIAGSAQFEMAGNLVLGAPLKRIQVVGDRAFIVSSPTYAVSPSSGTDPVDEDEVQPPRLFEVDVSDKANLKLVRSIRMPLTQVADMVADRKRVAVSGSGRVILYDPTALEKPMADIPRPGASGLFLDGDLLYAGCGGGLAVFALDEASPRLSGQYECPLVRAVCVTAGRAYLGYEERGRGLEIVDVSNAEKPKRLGLVAGNREPIHAGIEQAFDIGVKGSFLCVADYCFGLKVFDVSEPTNVRYVGGHFRYSRWWKVANFRVCTDNRYAYVGLRAAIELVDLP